MKFSPAHGALSILAYVLLAIAPMAVAFIGPLPALRSFRVEFKEGHQHSLVGFGSRHFADRAGRLAGLVAM